MEHGYRFSRWVFESLPLNVGTSQGNVVLGWWVTIEGIERAHLLARYADTYFETIRKALDQFARQTVYADDEALPILYLVSHSLELELKCSYEYRRIALDQADTCDLRQPKNIHELTKLLQSARMACCAGTPVEFLENDTCDFVEKVDQFNVGAAFRYAFDTSGRPAWADRPIVPMQILNQEFKIHGSEFQGLYYRLRDDVETDA